MPRRNRLIACYSYGESFPCTCSNWLQCRVDTTKRKDEITNCIFCELTWLTS